MPQQALDLLRGPGFAEIVTRQVADKGHFFWHDLSHEQQIKRFFFNFCISSRALRPRKSDPTRWVAGTNGPHRALVESLQQNWWQRFHGETPRPPMPTLERNPVAPLDAPLCIELSMRPAGWRPARPVLVDAEPLERVAAEPEQERRTGEERVAEEPIAPGRA